MESPNEMLSVLNGYKPEIQSRIASDFESIRLKSVRVKHVNVAPDGWIELQREVSVIPLRLSRVGNNEGFIDTEVDVNLTEEARSAICWKLSKSQEDLDPFILGFTYELDSVGQILKGEFPGEIKDTGETRTVETSN